MLTIKERQKSSFKLALKSLSVAVVAGGLYTLALVAAPSIPVLRQANLNSEVLAAMKPTENRLIIPTLSLTINYDTDEKTALSSGAWWKQSEAGNPATGGTFILAASHFSLQSTPIETAKKSPFYHLSNLKIGDKIIVDYEGNRYGYKVEKVSSTDTEELTIQNDNTLILESIDSNNTSTKNTVVQASPLGRVKVTS